MRAVFLVDGEEAIVAIGREEAARRLTSIPADRPAFQPRPLLEQELATWQGIDWMAREQAIVAEALRACETMEWYQPGEKWWQRSDVTLTSSTRPISQATGTSPISAPST